LSFCQFCQNGANAVLAHFWQFCHFVRTPFGNRPKIPNNRKRKGWVKKNLTKLINKVKIYIYLLLYITLYQYFRIGE